ncbi:hypothetical protein M23134_07314 [Microscilla marina ATCC 23134]|uniref:Uncharacterized protein n=1 Tax=Microscilla marina ATCC 23134 TaxID=313606 RepID=A1ZVG5_MICM2|nr:hypothetical protein M23134_07314 [Microscilla marina ATCC 23134]
MSLYPIPWQQLILKSFYLIKMLKKTAVLFFFTKKSVPLQRIAG